MALDPKPGLVVRFDFLWKEQADEGQEHGSKDRPCAVVLAATPREDGSRAVVLAPITHSAPTQDERGIEVPAAVAKYLGLDYDRSYIKTHQINTVEWPKDHLPFGIVPTPKGGWSYGELPQALGKKMFEQVRENSQSRSLGNVKRDLEAYNEYQQELSDGPQRDDCRDDGNER